MAEEIKICKLIIKGYDQFKDIELDFTDPKTGEPLEKICFIGRNGTGKSKILRIIHSFILSRSNAHLITGTFIVKFKAGNFFFYYIGSIWHEGKIKTPQSYYRGDIENEKDWLANFCNDSGEFSNKYLINTSHDNAAEKSLYNFTAIETEQFLLVYCPPEDAGNALLSLTDVPNTSLSNALNFSNQKEWAYQVSPSTVSGFWERLMYLIEMRRRENEKFEQNNLDKTKRQLIEEFDKVNPKILEKIAIVWNQILDKAGLEFDLANAKIPKQLNENLQAYLRLKDSKQRINYNALSTGIRNFIFKLGHIYSLYFDREVTSGILLLDEPENSLFPDFLYDLMDIYKQATTDKRGISNTQIFVATHNPIIAAQFKPEERIILDFDDEGGVIARRGVTPEGDDPNDILKQDFAVRSLLGRKGIEKWERYLDLKTKLHNNPKSTESKHWRKEILRIGEDYNFEI